ncbi:hypothetical protein [Xanthomonas indica]|uniref:AAA domain-containing protein n=1 Tax=Xanthomonas indica TaxID=2912242 RepID=A0AAU8I691_9XANT|nr:hypothetical protein [Xanthomonas indica]MCI2261095.1 hypothetical protein [Xanthomonas indica]
MRAAAAHLRWLRLLALALATWFLVSLLFAPWLNPWIAWRAQRDGQTLMLLQRSRIDMLLIREEALSHWLIHRQWPTAPALPGVQDAAQAVVTVDAPAEFELRFRYTNLFPPQSGLRGRALIYRLDPASQAWHCRPGIPPPSAAALIPQECRHSAPWTIVEWLALLLATAIALLLALALLWWRVRPAMLDVVRVPRRVFRHPIGTLPQLHRKLGWIRARDGVLLAAGIAGARWREAMAYARGGADLRAAALAARVEAVATRATDWTLPGQVWLWALPQSLPIALERLWLYQPDPALPGAAIVEQLRGMRSGQDVVLVVSPGADADAHLLGFASDPANLCACLDQAGQTEWLLRPKATEVLVALLARQLKVTRISPYQTHGGITRPASFFGREALLARVLNREPGNYLLVGGRQLGKTSLMKAIERRFAGHPHMYCTYLSLRDHRLAARLAAELRMPGDSGINALVDALAQRAGGRRLLLLVDETDLFLREEAASGYTQLAALRALSEEGRCHFMLAGFWDLYEAAVLDYASPIRNFGEVIHLAGLEHEACVALATEPMARLGIYYGEDRLPETLATACGQRANLVAIACQQLLERLPRAQRLIEAQAVHAAMHSDAMADALAGWARLSPDPLACRIDRILVYRVAQAHHAGPAARSQTAVVRMLADFDAAGVAMDAELLRRALARLQLAHVLRRTDDGAHYRFAVPLFAAQFQPGEVDALLARELQSLRAEMPPPA